MLILIILLPVLGFFSGSLLGRYLGKGVCIVTTMTTFFSFLLSLWAFLNIIKTGNIYILKISPWIYIDSLETNWKFYFDSLTATMLVIVTFISVLVHLYSTEYMEYDPHLPRFMSYLSLFTFFMLILVTANNFLQMFVGWEGVGVSSYLLINFWFTRIQANKAAIKAMLINRIGDFALLLSIFTIYFIYNSLDYDTIFTLTPLLLKYNITFWNWQIPIIDFICFLLFIGAMGKSAQIGLHTWLPDAMEGPTPVSALIHAATMVTAGVFLISRCSPIFEFSPLILNFIVLIGACTAFFAATTGLFQNDMKKVIAYSTCSQLGYMIFACGLSSYEVGMFHLSNHAFFKALLFLGAGSIIHSLSDEQDMRKMGGLKRILPFSYAITLIGSLALVGFPFLAGFYSKDVILEISYASFTTWGYFSYILGILAAFCTAFYSTRLLFLVFLAEPNGNKNIILNAHEGGIKLTLPLFILAIMSIFIGFLTKDLFIGFGTDFWGTSIFINPSRYYLTDIEFLEIKNKILPFLYTSFGIIFSYLLYRYKTIEYFILKKNLLFKRIYTFFNKKWFFDKLYNETISQYGLYLSLKYFYKAIDRGILEKIGPFGITELILSLSYHIKQIQTGLVINYLLYIFFSILILIIIPSKFYMLWAVLFISFFLLIWHKKKLY